MILAWLAVIGSVVARAEPTAPAPGAVAPADAPPLAPEIVTYLEQVRVPVASIWRRNLDELPTSVRLASDRYVTGVSVRLAPDGGLADLVVVSSSGSPELDDCVVRAFRSAAPFAAPPAALPTRDGFVLLPPFDFTVVLRPGSGPGAHPSPPIRKRDGADDRHESWGDDGEEDEPTTLHL